MKIQTNSNSFCEPIISQTGQGSRTGPRRLLGITEQTAR